jgi:hypothetical protein
MAENLGAEKFCMHQAMTDGYVAEYVLSIDSDESGKLLFQQLLNLCNSQYDILHQTDADASHRKHLLKN